MANAPYLIGYARVSKGEEQSNAAQACALGAAGCLRVLEEIASGGRWDRPRLHEMIAQLREGVVIVVWKLDRLSRSLKDLPHIMDRIEAAGAGFRSLTEAIDTTTAAGRMMMQTVGSFAQFERAMIRERTFAGLAQARRPATPRDRRVRHPRPQVRCRDGAALRRQRTHRLAHHRGISSGSGTGIVAIAHSANDGVLHRAPSEETRKSCHRSIAAD